MCAAQPARRWYSSCSSLHALLFCIPLFLPLPLRCRSRSTSFSASTVAWTCTSASDEDRALRPPIPSSPLIASHPVAAASLRCCCRPSFSSTVFLFFLFAHSLAQLLTALIAPAFRLLLPAHPRDLCFNCRSFTAFQCSQLFSFSAPRFGPLEPARQVEAGCRRHGGTVQAAAVTCSV